MLQWTVLIVFTICPPACFVGHLWVLRGCRPPLFALSNVEYVEGGMLSDELNIDQAAHIRAATGRSGMSQRHGANAGGRREERLPGFLPDKIRQQNEL